MHCFLLYSFNCFLVPFFHTANNVIGHVTIRLPGVDFLSVVHSDHAYMEIWPFEVLAGRLFQEQRSVVSRLVLNIALILYMPLRYVRNVPREE